MDPSLLGMGHLPINACIEGGKGWGVFSPTRFESCSGIWCEGALIVFVLMTDLRRKLQRKLCRCSAGARDRMIGSRGSCDRETEFRRALGHQTYNLTSRHANSISMCVKTMVNVDWRIYRTSVARILEMTACLLDTRYVLVLAIGNNA